MKTEILPCLYSKCAKYTEGQLLKSRNMVNSLPVSDSTVAHVSPFLIEIKTETNGEEDKEKL